MLFVLAGAILFARFPPADLPGLFASTLGVTIGVPLLIAAVLLTAAARLTGTQRSLRVLRIAALTLAAISTVMGLATLFTAA